MPVPDIKSVGVTYQPEKFHHVVKVVKGFSDTHHDNVGDALAAVLLGGDDLTQQLAWSEVAHLTAYGRGAEFAAHSTSYLRRDTDGVSVAVFHHYAFDAVSVRKREEIFYSAVDRRD